MHGGSQLRLKAMSALRRLSFKLRLLTPIGTKYRVSGMRGYCEETDHWELTPDRYLFPGDPTPRMSMPGFTSDVNKLPLSVSTTSVGIGLT